MATKKKPSRSPGIVNAHHARVDGRQPRLQHRAAHFGFDGVARIGVGACSMSFSATVAPLSVSCARYTSAMPPRPSLRRISYFPSFRDAGAIIPFSSPVAPRLRRRSPETDSALAAVSFHSAGTSSAFFSNTLPAIVGRAPSRAATPAPLLRRMSLCEIHGFRSDPGSGCPRWRNREWSWRAAPGWRRRGSRCRCPRRRFPRRPLPRSNPPAGCPSKWAYPSAARMRKPLRRAPLTFSATTAGPWFERRGAQDCRARHAAAQRHAAHEPHLLAIFARQHLDGVAGARRRQCRGDAGIRRTLAGHQHPRLLHAPAAAPTGCAKTRRPPPPPPSPPANHATRAIVEMPAPGAFRDAARRRETFALHHHHRDIVLAARRVGRADQLLDGRLRDSRHGAPPRAGSRPTPPGRSARRCTAAGRCRARKGCAASR